MSFFWVSASHVRTVRFGKRKSNHKPAQYLCGEGPQLSLVSSLTFFWLGSGGVVWKFGQCKKEA